MKYKHITEKWKHFINERSFDVTKAGRWAGDLNTLQNYFIMSDRFFDPSAVEKAHQKAAEALKNIEPFIQDPTKEGKSIRSFITSFGQRVSRSGVPQSFSKRWRRAYEKAVREVLRQKAEEDKRGSVTTPGKGSRRAPEWAQPKRGKIEQDIFDASPFTKRSGFEDIIFSMLDPRGPFGYAGTNAETGESETNWKIFKDSISNFKSSKGAGEKSLAILFVGLCALGLIPGLPSPSRAGSGAMRKGMQKTAKEINDTAIDIAVKARKAAKDTAAEIPKKTRANILAKARRLEDAGKHNSKIFKKYGDAGFCKKGGLKESSGGVICFPYKTDRNGKVIDPETPQGRYVYGLQPGDEIVLRHPGTGVMPAPGSGMIKMSADNLQRLRRSSQAFKKGMKAENMGSYTAIVRGEIRPMALMKLQDGTVMPFYRSTAKGVAGSEKGVWLPFNGFVDMWNGPWMQKLGHKHPDAQVVQSGFGRKGKVNLSSKYLNPATELDGVSQAAKKSFQKGEISGVQELGPMMGLKNLSRYDEPGSGGLAKYIEEINAILKKKTPEGRLRSEVDEDYLEMAAVNQWISKSGAPDSSKTNIWSDVGGAPKVGASGKNTLSPTWQEILAADKALSKSLGKKIKDKVKGFFNLEEAELKKIISEETEKVLNKHYHNN